MVLTKEIASNFNLTQYQETKERSWLNLDTQNQRAEIALELIQQ